MNTNRIHTAACSTMLAALVVTGCSVSVDDPEPATEPPTSATPTDEATTDEPTSEPTSDGDTLPTVPGYDVGEIPPVPLVTMPDLSLLTSADSRFATDLSELVGDYPGLTIEPVSCDDEGLWQVGGGTLLAYGDGTSYAGPDGTDVVFDDGTGATFDVDGTVVIVGADGSGSYSDDDVTIVTNGDGTGSYNSADLQVVVTGGGNGYYADAFGQVNVYGDARGGYVSADGTEFWNVESDGSGLYTGPGLTITNDGNGTATVNGTPVDAEPLEPVPPLGEFPSMAALEPRDSCGTTISLTSEVLFDIDSADVRPEAQPVLESLALALTDADVPAATIAGHTDSVRDAAHNQQLSEDRAASVADILVELGVTSDLTTVGYGEDRPIASNDTATGRQENRRVEIFIPTF